MNSLVPTGGGEALAIGAEGHIVDSVRVAAQGQQYLAALRVPHLRRLVMARGGEALAIGAEGHIENRTRVAAQGQQFLLVLALTLEQATNIVGLGGRKDKPIGIADRLLVYSLNILGVYIAFRNFGQFGPDRLRFLDLAALK